MSKEKGIRKEPLRRHEYARRAYRQAQADTVRAFIDSLVVLADAYEAALLAKSKRKDGDV